MPRRNKKSAQKENSERWLLTYADLITLLLIFFVILYAMSSLNAQKFMTLTLSLNAALDPSNKIPLQNLATSGLTTAAEPTTGDHSAGYSVNNLTKQQAKQVKSAISESVQFNNLMKSLEKYVHKNGLSNSVSLYNQARGIQITLKAVVLFQTGQDTLLPGAQKILSGLAPFLASVGNQIVVEGYTDNVPIHTTLFPSNWELSTGRAVNVVHFLIANQINPERLSAEGFGQYHPVVPNTSPINRQINRRVNIVILRSAVASIIDANSGPAGSTSQNVTLPSFKNLTGVNPSTNISTNYPSTSKPILPQNIFGTSSGTKK